MNTRDEVQCEPLPAEPSNGPTRRRKSANPELGLRWKKGSLARCTCVLMGSPLAKLDTQLDFLYEWCSSWYSSTVVFLSLSSPRGSRQGDQCRDCRLRRHVVSVVVIVKKWWWRWCWWMSGLFHLVARRVALVATHDQ